MIFISRIRRTECGFPKGRRKGAKKLCLFWAKNLNSSRIYATPNFLATLNKYIDEIEEDWGQVAFKTETVINSVGASNSVKDACTELKRLRINPEPCLGVMKKYWDNVQSAIARVKEAIHQG